MLEMRGDIKSQTVGTITTSPLFHQRNQSLTHPRAANLWVDPHGIQSAGIGSAVSLAARGDANSLGAIEGGKNGSRVDNRTPLLVGSLRLVSPRGSESVGLTRECRAP
jgi:hypothetical protein